MAWERTQRKPQAVTTGFTYKDARWVKGSRRHRRANPLCVACKAEGKITEAQCVDHIKPIGTPGVDPYDESNWQSLCKSHHSAKTIREFKPNER